MKHVPALQDACSCRHRAKREVIIFFWDALYDCYMIDKYNCYMLDKYDCYMLAKTSQFCFSPRNFASRALTKNTMAWLTGVDIPCLRARATTLPLIKSTSDCLFFRTSTHMEVLFSWREAITFSRI